MPSNFVVDLTRDDDNEIQVVSEDVWRSSAADSRQRPWKRARLGKARAIIPASLNCRIVNSHANGLTVKATNSVVSTGIHL